LPPTWAPYRSYRQASGGPLPPQPTCGMRHVCPVPGGSPVRQRTALHSRSPSVCTARGKGGGKETVSVVVRSWCVEVCSGCRRQSCGDGWRFAHANDVSAFSCSCRLRWLSASAWIWWVGRHLNASLAKSETLFQDRKVPCCAVACHGQWRPERSRGGEQNVAADCGHCEQLHVRGGQTRTRDREVGDTLPGCKDQARNQQARDRHKCGRDSRAGLRRVFHWWLFGG
jgi:hypothetical protein